MLKGENVIAVLNRLVDFIEAHLSEEIDVTGLASSLGTTEYHLRRMFSSLAGMPRCMVSARAMCAETAAPFAYNSSSGSA
jgi:AraC family transcriptional regulator